MGTRWRWLLVLGLVTGCGGPEVIHSQRSVRPSRSPRTVSPEPERVEPRTIRSWVPASFRQLSIACKDPAQTQGRVTVTFSPLDPQACGQGSELAVSIPTEDGGLVGACVLPVLGSTVMLARVEIRNGTRQILYLERSPVYVTSGDAVLGRASSLPERVRDAWHRTQDGWMVAAHSDPSQPSVYRIERATNLEPVFEAAKGVSFLSPQLVVLPGMSVTGHVAFTLPSSWLADSGPHSFEIGLYDVVADTERGGESRDKTFFKFACTATGSAIEALVQRVQEVAGVPVPDATAGGAPAASPKAVPPVVESPVSLGPAADLVAAGRLVEAWVGREVVVILAGNAAISGVLQGVSVPQMLVTTPSGSRSISMVEAVSIEVEKRRTGSQP